jgi:N-acylneuraminate cytidylyltransferase
VESKEFDSVFSASRSHAFLWKKDPSGFAVGINHTETKQRLRRQDRASEYQETGAFYVMDAAGFKLNKNRFFGRIGIIETKMPTLEIDNPSDLIFAEALVIVQKKPKQEILSKIKALVMDFDGVHTDDKVIVFHDGKEAVICSRSDGLGLEMLNKAELKLLIISKERNKIIKKRAEKLRVPYLNAIENKETALNKWLKENSLKWHEIAYIGNDVNDVTCMYKAGISFCPRDGHNKAKSAASGLLLSHKGGDGAIREVCDILIDILAKKSKTKND